MLDATTNKKYLTELEWGRVMAMAWQSPEFKAQLESNPKEAIQEHFPGFKFDNVLRLPEKPEDLSDEHLPELIDGTQLMPAAQPACTCC